VKIEKEVFRKYDRKILPALDPEQVRECREIARE